MIKFKPLRAVKAPDDLNTLAYPMIASPKLDGIRCIVRDGVALTRTLTPIPNKHIQRVLGDPVFEGLDGELIVGVPNAPDTWNKTQSGVMSIEGTPDFTFHVFDDFTIPDARFYRIPSGNFDEDMKYARFQGLCERFHGQAREGLPIECVPHVIVNSPDEIARWMSEWCARGYEGLMLRSPDGRYKYGHSTLKEKYLLKLKLWSDEEGIVVGFKEQMKNTAEASIDARGYVKRLKRKDTLEGKNTLGAFVVKMASGAEFDLGGGLSDAQRAKIWKNKDKYLGVQVKYRFQEKTSDGKPRFPVYLGVRDARD